MDIKKFFDNLWKTESTDWTYLHLPPSQTPENLPEEIIEPNVHYVEITLKSLRIDSVREGLKRFYGVVHSFISVPHLGGKNLDFYVVTAPNQLRDMDPSNADKIISVNIPLLGQVPYRGVGIKFELGLFSVKSSDLTESLVNLFSDMSAVAGVSFASAALPYAQFLNKGIDFLTGNSNDTNLEIGLSTTMKEMKTGYYVVMQASKDQVHVKDLFIDKDDYKLVNKNLEAYKLFPYMVFEVKASNVRRDWFQIPELSAAYQVLKQQLRSMRFDDAKKSLDALEVLLLNSDDLLFDDAEKIYRRIYDECDKILNRKSSRQEMSERQLSYGGKPDYYPDDQLPDLEQLNVS